MFCVFCGKEIPDNTVCDCRNKINDSADTLKYEQPQYEQPQPQYQQPQYQQPQYQQPQYQQPQYQQSQYQQSQYNQGYNNGGFNNFNNTMQLSDSHKLIKKNMGSTLMLVTAIIYSAGVAVSLFTSFSLSVITILTLVAIWMTYASAHKPDAPVKPTGMSMIGGVLVFDIVGISLGYASIAIVLIVAMFVAPRFLNMVYSEMLGALMDVGYTLPRINFTSAIFGIILVVVTGFFVFNLMYYITLRKSTLAIRDRVNQLKTTKRIGMFPSIVLLISGISSIASAVGMFFLTNAVNAIITEAMNSLAKELDIPLKMNFFTVTGYAYIGPCMVGIATVLFAIILIKTRNDLKAIEE